MPKKVGLIFECSKILGASQGGTFYYGLLLIEAFRNEDLKVFIEGRVDSRLITLLQSLCIDYEIIHRDDKYNTLPLSFFWEIFTYRGKLRDFDCVIISSSSLSRYVYNAFFCRCSLFIIHSITRFPRNKVNKAIYKLIIKKMIPNLLTVSNHATSLLSKQKIESTPLTNPSLFDSEFKNKLDIFNTPCSEINNIKSNYILTVGQLTYAKGCSEWLDIVEFFSLKKSEIQFIWIGDGSEKKWVEDESERRGLAENVMILTSPPADLKEIYKNSICLLHPSLYENYSLSLCDAAYIDLPFYCFDVGGNNEIVELSNYGNIIPKYEIGEKLYSELSLLIRRKSNRVNAIKYNRNFSIVKYIEKLFSHVNNKGKVKE
ncbi:glycosyltransferase [Vibrio splendidus]|uniref:glycosyltransferase n=1 Tax=Vibrio splendidus TaxID=29497 RepID=UPI00352DAB40